MGGVGGTAVLRLLLRRFYALDRGTAALAALGFLARTPENLLILPRTCETAQIYPRRLAPANPAPVAQGPAEALLDPPQTVLRGGGILLSQVSRGQAVGAPSDLTRTALPLSVSHAPRGTGTPLADGPGGRQGRLKSDHQLMMNWSWPPAERSPVTGGPEPQYAVAAIMLRGSSPPSSVKNLETGS